MKNAKILVIDDHEVNLLLLVELLTYSGYTVLEATTAEEAIYLAQKEKPSLILMDLGLPGMDGLEATSYLKTNPETRDIPIVIVSAHTMKQDKLRAKDAGCDGFIPKPVDQHLLLETIECFLPSHKTERPFQRPDETAQMEPEPEPAGTTEMSIDLDALLKSCMGNTKLIYRLVAAFHVQAETDLNQIQMALNGSDAEAVTAAAHRIKGAASELFAEDIRKHAAHLEALGRAHNLEGAFSVLQELRNKIQCLEVHVA